MKLRAKIERKYLEQILRGEKEYEYRQLESIILVDKETGEEFEFEILDIEKIDVKEVKKRYPDVPWKEGLLTVAIKLGRRIR